MYNLSQDFALRHLVQLGNGNLRDLGQKSEWRWIGGFEVGQEQHREEEVPRRVLRSFGTLNRVGIGQK